MNTMDSIKQYESVGFSRKQAELQVRSMDDFKKELATKKDVETSTNMLNSRMDFLSKDLGSGFEMQNKRLDAQDRKIDGQSSKIDGLEYKIDTLPLQTSVYTAGILLTLVGLYKLIPVIAGWF